MPAFKPDTEAIVEVSFLVRVNGQIFAEVPVLKTSHTVDGGWLKAQLHKIRTSIRRN